MRNPDDNLLRAIGDKGGVIMVNIGSSFLSQASRRSSEQATQAFQAYLRESGEARDSEAAKAWRAAYAAENPYLRATLSMFWTTSTIWPVLPALMPSASARTSTG